MIPVDALLNAFATYFVTIDPPGQAAIFLGLTTGMTRAQRQSIALRGTLLGICILIAFMFLGSGLLGVLGISMAAFRVAGGLLLFFIAAEMLFERRAERRGETAEKVISDKMVQSLAVFPLAVPFVAGPGAISAAILQSERFVTPIEQAAHIGVLLVVGLILYIVLIIAARAQRFISEAVSNVITRLLGILLAALAVQFIADGAKALIV
ncbi:MAG: MarC family protein [Pseudomonadota bacterium]